MEIRIHFKRNNEPMLVAGESEAALLDLLKAHVKDRLIGTLSEAEELFPEFDIGSAMVVQTTPGHITEGDPL